MNTEQQIQLLMEQIRKLQKERDNTPKHQHQVIDSITDDINYYQNQIEFLTNQN